jgi:hypothetical protein
MSHARGAPEQAAAQKEVETQCVMASRHSRGEYPKRALRVQAASA